MANETLICNTCTRSFTRKRSRGRKPKECPTCRNSDAAPAPVKPVEVTQTQEKPNKAQDTSAAGIPLGTRVEVPSYQSGEYVMPGFSGTVQSEGIDDKGVFVRVQTSSGLRSARLDKLTVCED